MSDVYQPSTPREAFEVTTCHGKQKYASPQLAHRRVREMKVGKLKRHGKKGPARNVYRCTVCNQWHLGGAK